MRDLIAPIFFIAYIVLVVFSNKKNEEYCNEEQSNQKKYDKN